MKTANVKNGSNWPATERALSDMGCDRWETIPDAVFAAIADRIRNAIESSESDHILKVAHYLENFYRKAAAAAPEDVREVTRAGSKDRSLNAAYVLGKTAFAQLLASRVADTRADDRFIRSLQSPRYRPYVEALVGAPLSVAAVQQLVGKRLETVSRALTNLRALGVVMSRKEGTTVMNSLSPAARAMVEHLGLGLGEQERKPVSEAAQDVLEEKREALPNHMKAPPGFSSLRKAA